MATEKALNPKEIEIYAIRSSSTGKWLRRKGFGGSGDCWVDDFTLARLYQKVGQAKAQITTWTKMSPKHGIPELVRLHVGHLEVIDQTMRVREVLEKQKQAGAKREVRAKKEAIKKAERELEEAKRRLNRLTSS